MNDQPIRQKAGFVLSYAGNIATEKVYCNPFPSIFSIIVFMETSIRDKFQGGFIFPAYNMKPSSTLSKWANCYAMKGTIKRALLSNR